MNYKATFTTDDCVGCGTHLAYQPTLGEEAECPNCHTVHIIDEDGKLKQKV